MKACRPSWWQITDRDTDGLGYIPWDLYHRDATNRKTMNQEIFDLVNEDVRMSVMRKLARVRRNIRDWRQT